MAPLQSMARRRLSGGLLLTLDRLDRFPWAWYSSPMPKTQTAPVWTNSLREVRTRKGFSQVFVAESVGIAQQTIVAIEQGKLSGRRYMDDIGRCIKEDPRELFPYYDMLTYGEAATVLGVSSALVARRVDEGELKVVNFGRIPLIPKSEVEGKSIRKRPGPSIRQALVDILRNSNGEGCTVEALLVEFEPFESEEEKVKRKRSIQSVLSRTPEFVVNRDINPPTWYLDNETRRDTNNI